MDSRKIISNALLHSSANEQLMKMNLDDVFKISFNHIIKMNFDYFLSMHNEKLTI
jgi:hypothetical protein